MEASPGSSREPSANQKTKSVYNSRQLRSRSNKYVSYASHSRASFTHGRSKGGTTVRGARASSNGCTTTRGLGRGYRGRIKSSSLANMKRGGQNSNRSHNQRGFNVNRRNKGSGSGYQSNYNEFPESYGCWNDSSGVDDYESHDAENNYYEDNYGTEGNYYEDDNGTEGNYYEDDYGTEGNFYDDYDAEGNFCDGTFDTEGSLESSHKALMPNSEHADTKGKKTRKKKKISKDNAEGKWNENFEHFEKWKTRVVEKEMEYVSSTISWGNKYQNDNSEYDAEDWADCYDDTYDSQSNFESKVSSINKTGRKKGGKKTKVDRPIKEPCKKGGKVKNIKGKVITKAPTDGKNVKCFRKKKSYVDAVNNLESDKDRNCEYSDNQVGVSNKKQSGKCETRFMMGCVEVISRQKKFKEEPAHPLDLQQKPSHIEATSQLPLITGPEATHQENVFSPESKPNLDLIMTPSVVAKHDNSKIRSPSGRADKIRRPSGSIKQESHEMRSPSRENRFKTIVLIADSTYQGVLKKLERNKVIVIYEDLSQSSLVDVVHKNKKRICSNALWVFVVGIYDTVIKKLNGNCQVCKLPLTEIMAHPDFKGKNTDIIIDNLLRTTDNCIRHCQDVLGFSGVMALVPPIPALDLDFGNLKHSELHYNSGEGITFVRKRKYVHLNYVYNKFCARWMALSCWKLQKLFSPAFETYAKKSISKYLNCATVLGEWYSSMNHFFDMVLNVYYPSDVLSSWLTIPSMFDQVVIVGDTEHAQKLKSSTFKHKIPVVFLDKPLDLDENGLTIISDLQEQWPSRTLWCIVIGISVLTHPTKNMPSKCSVASPKCKSPLPVLIAKNNTLELEEFSGISEEEFIDIVVQSAVYFISKAAKMIGKGSALFVAPVIPQQAISADSVSQESHSSLHKVFEKDPSITFLLGSPSCWVCTSSKFSKKLLAVSKECFLDSSSCPKLIDDYSLQDHPELNFINSWDDTRTQSQERNWSKLMLKLFEYFLSLRNSDHFPFTYGKPAENVYEVCLEKYGSFDDFMSNATTRPLSVLSSNLPLVASPTPHVSTPAKVLSQSLTPDVSPLTPVVSPILHQSDPLTVPIPLLNPRTPTTSRAVSTSPECQPSAHASIPPPPSSMTDEPSSESAISLIPLQSDRLTVLTPATSSAVITSQKFQLSGRAPVPLPSSSITVEPSSESDESNAHLSSFEQGSLSSLPSTRIARPSPSSKKVIYKSSGLSAHQDSTSPKTDEFILASLAVPTSSTTLSPAETPSLDTTKKASSKKGHIMIHDITTEMKYSEALELFRVFGKLINMEWPRCRQTLRENYLMVIYADRKTAKCAARVLDFLKVFGNNSKVKIFGHFKSDKTLTLKKEDLSFVMRVNEVIEKIKRKVDDDNDKGKLSTERQKMKAKDFSAGVKGEAISKKKGKVKQVKTGPTMSCGSSVTLKHPNLLDKEIEDGVMEAGAIAEDNRDKCRSQTKKQKEEANSNNKGKIKQAESGPTKSFKPLVTSNHPTCSDLEEEIYDEVVDLSHIKPQNPMEKSIYTNMRIVEAQSKNEGNLRPTNHITGQLGNPFTSKHPSCHGMEEVIEDVGDMPESETKLKKTTSRSSSISRLSASSSIEELECYNVNEVSDSGLEQGPFIDSNRHEVPAQSEDPDVTEVVKVLVCYSGDLIAIDSIAKLFIKLGALEGGTLKEDGLHFVFKKQCVELQLLECVRFPDRKMRVHVSGVNKAKVFSELERRASLVKLEHLIVKLLRPAEKKLKISIGKEINVYTFKTTPCKNLWNCPLQETCHGYHGSEDRRRPPLVHDYCIEKCVEMDSIGTCHIGDFCVNAHTAVEKMMHLTSFRSMLCPFVHRKGYCEEMRKICYYAHKGEPDMLYNDDWEDLHVEDLGKTTNFLCGAVTNLYKLPNLKCPRVLLITPTNYMADFYLNCISDLTSSCGQKAMKLELDTASCFDATIIITTSETILSLLPLTDNMMLTKDISFRLLRALIIDDGPTIFNSLHDGQADAFHSFGSIMSDLNIVVTAEELSELDSKTIKEALNQKSHVVIPRSASPKGKSSKMKTVKRGACSPSPERIAKETKRRKIDEMPSASSTHFFSPPKLLSKSSEPLGRADEKSSNVSKESSRPQDSKRTLSDDSNASSSEEDIAPSKRRLNLLQAIQTLEKKRDREHKMYVETPMIHPLYEEKYKLFRKKYKKDYGEVKKNHAKKLWKMYWSATIKEYLKNEYQCMFEDLQKKLKNEMRKTFEINQRESRGKPSTTGDDFHNETPNAFSEKQLSLKIQSVFCAENCDKLPSSASLKTKCHRKRKSSEKSRECTRILAKIVQEPNVRQLQAEDRTLSDLYRCAREGVVERKDSIESSFAVKNGLLYRNVHYESLSNDSQQLILPIEYRQIVIRFSHCGLLSGHVGRAKTYDRIMKEFYWPSLYKDVKVWVTSCETCQATAPEGSNIVELAQPMPIIGEPFTRCALDLIGPLNPSVLGYKYILILTDFATKWPEAVPLKSISSVAVASALGDIFARLGVPLEILSDHGMSLTSCLDEIFRLMKMKGMKTIPDHCECNGTCERLNSSLKKILKCLCFEQPKSWHEFVKPLLFGYREIEHKITGFSPFCLLFGKDFGGSMHILRNFLEDNAPDDEETCISYQYVLELKEWLPQTCALAQEECQKSGDCSLDELLKHFNLRSFTSHDEVLILSYNSSDKLLAEWQGPYRIKKKKKLLYYFIDIDGKEREFHINMLKTFSR